MRTRRSGRALGAVILLAVVLLASSGGLATPTAAAGDPAPLELGSTLADVTPGDGDWIVAIPHSGGVEPLTWELLGTDYPKALRVWDLGYLIGPNAAAGTYEVTIRITDAEGASATGTFSLRILPPTAPGKPVDVRATGMLGGRVRVDWSTTGSGGSPITGYVVTPHRDGVPQPPVDAAASGVVVSGLTVGATYTFTVSARNAVGVGPASLHAAPVTVIDVPAPPTDVRVTLAGQPQQATVTWEAAADAGHPITGFDIGYRTEGDGPVRWYTSTDASTRRALLWATYGEARTYVVRAKNGIGESGWASTAAPATAWGRPDPPVVGVPYARMVDGAPAIAVSWTDERYQGEATSTGFRVRARDFDREVHDVVVPAGSTSAVVPGLTFGTTYGISVVGLSEVGEGDQGYAPQNVALTVPKAPAFASASPARGSAKVAWWPYAATNGLPILDITVTPIRDGVPAAPQIFPGAPSSAILTGLGGGSTSFRIVARNAAGESAAATTAPVAIEPLVVPMPPGTPLATTGAGSASVRWSAPADNGGPAITSYVVTPSVGSTALAPTTVPASSTSVTITGLANGGVHTFRVAAVNADGSSAPSAASAPIRVGVPGAPVGPTAGPRNASATVAVGRVAANGGPITGYTVRPMLGTTALPVQRFSASSTSLRVTGLANGAVYTFKVAAVNRYGPSAATTTPALRIGTPTAPTRVSATGGRRSALVSWTAPSSNNGAAVTRYLVTPYVGSVSQPTVAFDASTTKRAISGLKAGTSYTFRIRAVNSRGASPMSSATKPVTPT